MLLSNNFIKNPYSNYGIYKSIINHFITKRIFVFSHASSGVSSVSMRIVLYNSSIARRYMSDE